MSDNREQRHWPMDGAHNVRDVGGYPTTDGHQTRWRVLLRADGLHRLSDADQSILRAAGLHTVIDLRYSQEAERAPDVFVNVPDIHYYNIQLLPGAVSAGVLPDAARMQPPTSLDGVYKMLVDHCQPTLKQAISLVADETDGAVIVHCTLGKDRTGVITALLLSAVGVADETIVEDYALTGECVKGLLPELREQALIDGRDPVTYERMLATDPANIATFLKYVRDKYGSTHDYLRQIGITDSQLAALRARLVV